MDSAQGAFDGALRGMTARRLGCKAIGQNDGAIDGSNDFERGNQPRIARQAVAAVSSMRCGEEARLAQLLQELGKNRERNAAAVGHLFRASRRLGTRDQSLSSEVSQGDQTIIRFFSEPKHLEKAWPLLDSGLATDHVLFVYSMSTIREVVNAYPTYNQTFVNHAAERDLYPEYGNLKL